ncbi:MAG: DUF3231 family protein [Bacillota bacterium]
MVQIGDFHIGKAETAKQPTLSIQEASYLWDFLVGRYKCLEETNIYLNLAKDKEFIAMINVGIYAVLKKQTEKIEKEMEKYRIPLPQKQSVSYKHLLQSEIEINDEFMFRQIFEGCQNYIDYLARICRSLVLNDSLRNVFIEFLNSELFFFDKMCMYGKSKGWLEAPPIFKH